MLSGRVCEMVGGHWADGLAISRLVVSKVDVLADLLVGDSDSRLQAEFEILHIKLEQQKQHERKKRASPKSVFREFCFGEIELMQDKYMNYDRIQTS